MTWMISAVMAVVSLPINYYIVYPIYENFMPLENIIGAYQAILPRVKTLWQCLLVFNVPFIRALAAAGVSIVIVALLVALTLIPALCVLGARRILRTRRTEVTGDS